MSRRIISALVTAVALGGTPSLSSAQIIDTRPPGQEFFWSGFSSGGVMLGQSFSTGAVDTFLSALTLYDVRVDTGEPVTYSAFVAEWNSGTQTTGAQVWSTSGSDLSTSFSDLSFAVSTQLNPSSTYLFALVASAANGHFFMGATPYAGGEFYYQTASNPSGAWSSQWVAYDLETSIELTPEPSSILLFGSGLIGLVGFGVARRQLIV